MKFAHLADVHIGSWRDPKLKDLSTEAFIKAVDMALERNVDFFLIAGDLFNTALPGIDNLKTVVKKLREIRKAGLRVYAIAGSHDFSPSGKTMLDVLEEAGLLINVFKGNVKDDVLELYFTVDPKTNVKITGVPGFRGMLDKKLYKKLKKESLEKEEGKKIFMFHTSIDELKPTEMAKMDSEPVNMMPKGFDYYAGGHVHIIKRFNSDDYKNVIYPGPVFPANFSEMEKLGRGSFYIYDNGNLEQEVIQIKNIQSFKIDANDKTPEEVEEIINEQISKKEFVNTIVLLRIEGILKSGKTSDLKFKEIFKKIYDKGAYFVMKSTSKLSSKEFEEIKISHSTTEEIEQEIIKENLGRVKTHFTEKEEEITKELMRILSSEKHEGEKAYEYEERVKKEAKKIVI
jgi:DNA repair exonuclease SbcCD nuclease subunit